MEESSYSSRPEAIEINILISAKTNRVKDNSISLVRNSKLKLDI
jgi:hypothetical protein